MKEINILKTRSFWVLFGAFVSATLNIFGLDVIIEPESFADNMLPFVIAALGLWAYLERIFGKKKIVFRKENSVGETIQ